jgi:Terpene synthase family 2, C-terminal metal binding
MDSSVLSLHSPFPRQVNQHVEQARAQVTQWVDRSGLVRREPARKRFEKADFGWFAAVVYPRADGPRLDLMADWFAWLFLVDDQLDDGGFGRDLGRVGQVVGHMREVLENPGAAAAADPDVPTAISSLAGLWKRTAAGMSAAWCRRFVRHLVECLETAAVWEAGNRVTGTVPDEAAYVAKRRHTGAIYVCMDLIDVVERIDVPPEVYESPRFTAALDAACDVVVWTNDVYSLEKERSVGEVHNLVYIVEHHRALDRAAALAHVCAAVATETERYLASELELLMAFPAHAEVLAPYAAGMRSWMRGNLDWSRSTRRYQPDDQREGSRPSEYLEAMVIGPGR